MNVGDLVTWAWGDGKEYGVVIETGIYTGKKDTKVLWWDSEIMTESADQLVVVR